MTKLEDIGIPRSWVEPLANLVVQTFSEVVNTFTSAAKSYRFDPHHGNLVT